MLNEIDEPLLPSKIDLPSHLVDNYIISTNPEKDHRHTNKYVKNDNFFLSKKSQIINLNQTTLSYKLVNCKKH